ncbi:hypothetical protein B1R32_10328 [Abditibacterium utsteinense]|uniref:Uncharacterized protein n=2 Tax=Abditibacterium utsteinense TaxID=1960156 RepID=A0A2S8SVF3_9BACT|nr:hypothetical protein B1R32_10328 [Abditibacterium utsteinense]
MAIVAALALGAGVTGTMLWMENRAPVPVASAPVAAPAASENLGAAPVAGNAPSNVPAMPPSVAGMTPGEAALTLGNWHYDSAQWPQAVAQYRVAITKGLDNPNVRTDLGNALRFDNQPEKALEQYKIAQKQDPQHEQSLFNQGGLWAITLKNPKNGIEAWNAYLKRFPKGATADQARKFIAQFTE